MPSPESEVKAREIVTWYIPYFTDSVIPARESMIAAIAEAIDEARAEEREAIAQEIDSLKNEEECRRGQDNWEAAVHEQRAVLFGWIAAAIRARR